MNGNNAVKRVSTGEGSGVKEVNVHPQKFWFVKHLGKYQNLSHRNVDIVYQY